MATLPTIPGPFTDGTAPTLAQLSQLAYAVSFISDCDVRPTWHFYQTSTFALTASTWTTPATVGLPYLVAFDSDGVHQPTSATIVTQGIYAVEACFDIAASSNTPTLLGGFLFTAGGSNPHFTLGTTLRFGARGSIVPNDNSADPAICVTDICPVVCYPGDTLQSQVFSTVAVTLKANSNDAYNQGRYVSNFTGMFIAEGT